MKMKTLMAAGIGAMSLLGGAAQASDVGVSVHISQPGVYGRIDIGRFPQPEIFVAQPVIIRQVVRVAPEPAYLWVPPGHRKNWRKHCGKYDACGTPVYFVQDRWYHEHVNGPADRRDNDNKHDKKDKKDKHDRR